MSSMRDYVVEESIEEYQGGATFTTHERQELLAGGLLRYLKSKSA